MKNKKAVFSVIIVLTLICGLAYRNRNTVLKHESSEFLFDTVCSITAYSSAAQDKVAAAFDETARIHRLTDFFDENSDVSKINRAGAGEEVTVDIHTINIIELAQRIGTDSKGAFDITLAPVSELWDFKTDTPVPPDKASVADALELCGRDVLLTDKVKLTVTKAYDQTRIDLGGIAKGYAADAAAELLEKEGVDSAIIDFGGNIVVVGKNPKTSDGKWRIGLQTPFAQTGEYSKTVEITEGGAVTSGTYQRYFEYDGALYHHIINPETGYPAQQSYNSVTVCAPSAAAADALATAIFVLGEEEGKALAEKWGASVEFL